MTQTAIERREGAVARPRHGGGGRLPLEPLALLAIGALALALRLWPLNHFSLDFQDEGAYWQSLRAMAAGRPLFSVVFSSQPPFFLLGLLPFYLLFGGTIEAARLGVVLYALLGLAATYYIGRVTAGRWAGVIACALLAVDPLYLVESHTLQAEAPSEGLALAGVALAAVAAGRSGGQRRWRVAVSGVALGLGVLTKLFDVAALVPAALYLAAPIFAALRDKGDEGDEGSGQRRAGLRRALRAVIPDLALLAAGCVVACAAVLAPFFPVRGLVYDQVVRFHQVAQRIGFAGSIDWRANLGIIRDTVTEYYAAPYLLLALAGIALAVWRRAWTVVPLLAWLVISFGLLVQQRPLLWHHVVLLAPLLAILAGSALPLILTPHPRLSSRAGEASDDVGGMEGGTRRIGRPPSRDRVLWPLSRAQGEGGRGGEGVLALVALVFVVVSALTALGQSVEADRSRVDPNPPPAALQLDMARVLRAQTRPGELVVTDGQYIAGLAGRSVPAELVDTSAVRIDTGKFDPRYFSTGWIESIIARDHIRAILFATDRLYFRAPAFSAWVRRRYHLVASFGKGRALYQR